MCDFILRGHRVCWAGKQDQLKAGKKQKKQLLYQKAPAKHDWCWLKSVFDIETNFLWLSVEAIWTSSSGCGTVVITL